eukprot:s345_g9.t1
MGLPYQETRRTTMPVLWNWARRRLRVSCSLIQAAHEKPLRRQVQKRAFGAQTDAEKEGIVYNACISACEKAGQWQHALALFQEMEGCRIPRTSITYNATISACEKGHEWERALRFVAEMEIFDVERCAITYNACIAACDEAGQWQHALLLLGDMSRNQGVARPSPLSQVRFQRSGFAVAICAQLHVRNACGEGRLEQQHLECRYQCLREERSVVSCPSKVWPEFLLVVSHWPVQRS